jgi:hypothetical protein
MVGDYLATGVSIEQAGCYPRSTTAVKHRGDDSPDSRQSAVAEFRCVAGAVGLPLSWLFHALSIGGATIMNTGAQLIPLTAILVLGAPLLAQAQCLNPMAQLMISRSYSRQYYYTPTYGNHTQYTGPSSYSRPSYPAYSNGTNYSSYNPRSLNYTLNLYNSHSQTQYSSNTQQQYGSTQPTMYQYHTSSYTANSRYSHPGYYQPLVGIGYSRWTGSFAPHSYEASSTRYHTSVTATTYTYPTSRFYTAKQSSTTSKGNQYSLVLGQYGSKQSQYQGPRAQYQTPAINYSKPASDPIPMKIPGMTLHSRVVENVSVSVKFSASCGKCHFPKSSQPQQLTVPLRSMPAQLVQMPASSIPLQLAPPYLLSTRPTAVSISSILQSSAPESKAGSSLPPLLRTERLDDTARSIVARVMTAPPLPLTLSSESSTSASSRSAHFRAAEPAGRLLPEAVLSMPPLPSGLPVLPPVTSDEAAPQAPPPLVEVVLQPPPMPTERD